MPVTRSQSKAGNPRANRPRTLCVALTTIANRRAIEHMIFGGQLDEELKRRNMNDEDLCILRPEFYEDNNPPQEKYAELAQRLCLPQHKIKNWFTNQRRKASQSRPALFPKNIITRVDPLPSFKGDDKIGSSRRHTHLYMVDYTDNRCLECIGAALLCSRFKMPELGVPVAAPSFPVRDAALALLDLRNPR